MEIEFDPAKDAFNLEKHGLPLVFAIRALADPNLISVADDRHAYGEDRRVSLGRVGGRVFVVVHTRRGEVERIISVRKANAREQRRYDQAQGHP